MTKFIIKNVSKNQEVEHMCDATTLGELIQELEEAGKGDAIPPRSNVMLRPERVELSNNNTFPADREEIILNVFAAKLAAGSSLAVYQ